MAALKEWHSVDVDGKVFRVPRQLSLVKRLGSGAYGTVASFKDTGSGRMVAVKKIANAFDDLVDGKRNLREVKLLQSLSHANIVPLVDMYPPEHPDFNDVYIVQELMDTDLAKVINSKQELSEEHNRYFTYQLLCGLHYLHSANVIHRDIKPANLLANKNCDVKICDFGLSRGIDEDAPIQVTGAPGRFRACDGFYRRAGTRGGKPRYENATTGASIFRADGRWILEFLGSADACTFSVLADSDSPPGGTWPHDTRAGCSVKVDAEPELTEYIVTRWYRAPEVILLHGAYTKAIDMWSAGCVCGELFGRKALFPGKDHLDQVKRVISVLGTPSPEDLDWLPRQSAARKFLNRLPHQPKRPWSRVYPAAGRDACHALERMLTLHPENRATAAEAMQMDFFQVLHRPEDLLQTARDPVDWSFDNFRPTRRLLQNHMYAECARFHPDILQRDRDMLPSRGIDRLLPKREMLSRGGC